MGSGGFYWVLVDLAFSNYSVYDISLVGNNHLCEAECWSSVTRVKLQSESQVLAHR